MTIGHCILVIDISLFFYSRCYFTTSAVHNRNKFIEQLNYSFGSGGMTCGMDNNVLLYFIQSMKRRCPQKLPTKKAVTRPGKPEGCMLYFVNKDVIVDCDGKLVNEEGSAELKKRAVE